MFCVFLRVDSCCCYLSFELWSPTTPKTDEPLFCQVQDWGSGRGQGPSFGTAENENPRDVTEAADMFIRNEADRHVHSQANPSPN
jgi:hypothetical protein